MNVSETGQKQMGPLTVDFQGGGGGDMVYGRAGLGTAEFRLLARTG